MSALTSTPTTLPATSPFARLHTTDEIHALYEAMTSPENLHCDGERPARAANRLAAQYRRDAMQRLTEIGQ